MDLHAEQFLKILDEAGVVEKAAAGLPFYEQVEIALRAGFAARHRAEDAHSAGTATAGELKDFLPPPGAQCIECEHAFTIVRELGPDRAPLQHIGVGQESGAKEWSSGPVSGWPTIR